MSSTETNAVKPLFRTPAIFSQFKGLVAAESTRHGGVSKSPYASLNLGGSQDDPASIMENNFRFFQALNIPFDTVAKSHQVHEDKILNSFRKIDHLLSRYFIGLIGQMTILFVLYLIVLLIFGVQNAFVIAFITALLNIIPYIGPLIATVLVAVLTMLSNMGPESQGQMLSTTLYVLIGYSVAQIIDNNVTTPLIFSNSVNSHPLEIFIVILASGFVFGVLGMIVAVPLYTVIKVVAKEFFPENPVVKVLTKGI